MEVIEKAVLTQLSAAKEERACVGNAEAHTNPLFKAIGMKSEARMKFTAPWAARKSKAVLDGSDDWKVQFDFEDEEGACTRFPQKLRSSLVEDHVWMV